MKLIIGGVNTLKEQEILDGMMVPIDENFKVGSTIVPEIKVADAVFSVESLEACHSNSLYLISSFISKYWDCFHEDTVYIEIDPPKITYNDRDKLWVIESMAIFVPNVIEEELRSNPDVKITL